MAAFAASLLSTAAIAADASSPPTAMQGGGMRGFLSPEERAMMFSEMQQETAGMTDDQKHAWRDQRRAKVMGMSDADKQKMKADLDAKWAALTPAQQADLKQKAEAMRSQMHAGGDSH
jgi:hypothetical protein